jgi:hypothetical protein
MNFTVSSTGKLDDMRVRLAMARAALPSLLNTAVHDAGDWVAQNLKDASPVGANEGDPPQGDGPGRLAASYVVQDEPPPSEAGAAISVRTTQPTKLSFVRYGTGIYGPRGQRIRPTTKKALMWPGAAHPVRSVAGQHPNDFVTPILDDAPTAEDALQVAYEEIVNILEG